VTVVVVVGGQRRGRVKVRDVEAWVKRLVVVR